MAGDPLGPHVVGQRVVVRRVLPGETGPSGGPAMTDVIGTCESWDEAVVLVRREQGDVVSIPTAHIVSGRTVPPRARRRGSRWSDEEADRLVLPGWPPAESEPLGDWLLRASGGFSNRGNSVLALGDPGVPPEEALARVVSWYDARSLAPRAHVNLGSDGHALLTDAGWRAYEPTTLMLASVDRLLDRIGDVSGEVRHAQWLDDGWLATDERAARFGAAARQVLESGTVTFATVRDDDALVLSRGRGAVHGGWVGVASLWTDPARRGRGHGTAVLRSLLEWGVERGATTAYLQVISANEPAMRLYESRGFEPHHGYSYYVAPTDG